MSEPIPSSSTLRNPGQDLIRQFVIYAENKVGWLNDFIVMLKSDEIQILAISVLDTSDSSVIRLVPNYPKDLARLLKSQSISFTERNIIAAEIKDEDSIHQITHSLLRAEINIHYVYPFLNQPNNRPVLAIAMEDEDIGEEALKAHRLTVLSLEDFNR
jgi:hypothetical protein